MNGVANRTGVKSGTCVVDDLVLQRVQRHLLLLHTLCVESDQAAEVVGQLARGLSYEQLQQMQVGGDSGRIWRARTVFIHRI